MSDAQQQAHRERMKKLQAEKAAEVREKKIRRGVVVVHTGDGKGKSTAGFGVAFRAFGHGQRVAIVQFIKGTWKTGEAAVLQRFPEIEHIVSGDGFTWDTQDRANDIASAEKGWNAAKDLIESERFDVIVLDEINVALKYGYLDAAEVATALRDKPEELSIVLTGRNAPQAVIDAADTVTEHKVVKHAFSAGIRARKGVEF
ncbi:MAG: cob(I)yrinic acid a,c-diamide adenosyltransferase [Myxococcota bacterium]